MRSSSSRRWSPAWPGSSSAYRDQQVSRIALDSRPATTLRTENIGRAAIRGAEADLEYLLSGHTQLSASVQYLDAVYDSYSYVNFGPPVTGCAVLPLGQNQFQVDCSGRRAPYAPEWTIGLGAGQVFQLPRGASLTARGRARYQSEALMGLDFLPQQQQDDYWVVDASLTFGTAGDRYSLGLFGQNLTDGTVISNTFVVPFSTFVVGVLRPPRTLGVRLSARF